MRAARVILLSVNVLLLGSLLWACSRTRGADPRFLREEQPDDGTDEVPCPQCDDGLYCTGVETCEPHTASCLPAEPVDCDDRDECTIDSCNEREARCNHVATPRDQDRDGFDACDDDCDDQEPRVHPGATETCDRVDEDCDERSDEGLRSECDDCRPGCRLLYLPERGEDWNPTEDNSDSVQTDGPGGPLVLTGETRQRFDAWIANFVDGTVTKLDTRTGAQLARYHSVLDDGRNHAEPPDALCDRDGEQPGGNCPSRTAVDLHGAVYVANRAFGRQGTVTKIAGFPDDCIDRNDNGRIDTSRDLNENGQIDERIEGELLGQADECLLWTVDVGGDGSVPRALAIAADGHVWVGLHGESRVLELHPEDGRVLRSVAVPGFKPYGAAIDSQGRLWLVESLTGQIVSVDTKTGDAGRALRAPEVETGCPSSYGITIDGDDRVWIAGFSCPFAFRFDPEERDWLSVPLPDSGITRGIAADGNGRIFVASSHEWIRLNLSSSFGFFDASEGITRLSVLSDEGERLYVLDLPGRGAIGVGLDDQSRAWLVSQETGTATRVALDHDGPGQHEVKNFAAGDLPYTYSDFTGFALRRITAATGFIRGVLEGCASGPSEWEELRVDANTPDAAGVSVRVRSASRREELETARWLGPFDGRVIELSSLRELDDLRFIEVEARLISGDRRSSPELEEIRVQVHCPL